MKLTITGRHLEIPDAARQQIDRKLKYLERLLNDSVVSAQCVLSQERGMYVCEVTVHARQDHTLHGLGRHAQVARAVTLAADKVAQQAQRLKDRWKTRRRTPNGAGPRTVPAGERVPSDAGPRVIKSRRSAVKPMTLDDAMLSLSGGAQSFLVFRDAASDGVTILYRRPDGNYGLIEPEP
jgi:putative sigma-54 modulation protein